MATEPDKVVSEETPPANVLVAVDVEVMVPVVREPVVTLEKMEDAARKMLANNEVEVALVPVALVKVRL